MARETAAERQAREDAERAEQLAAQPQVDAQAAVDAGDGSRVKVPAEVGDEIVFTRGVDEVARFKVSDGYVSVKDDGERAMLLANVPGAVLAD